MRLLTIAIATSLLLPAVPVFACGAKAAQSVTTELSAAGKKKPARAVTKKAPKVEYMRAVPWK